MEVSLIQIKVRNDEPKVKGVEIIFNFKLKLIKQVIGYFSGKLVSIHTQANRPKRLFLVEN